MRKLICSLLLLTFLFTSPVYAKSCFGQKLVHNVKRLMNAMSSFGKIKNASLNNYNSRISIALKIGRLREVIDSGQAIGSKTVSRSNVYSAYVSALNSFEEGMDDLEHALRDKNQKYVAKATKHINTGLKKLKAIRRAIQ